MTKVSPKVESFFDPATNTVTHCVMAPGSRACAVVDPVLDYDPKSGKASTASADAVIAFIKENDRQLEWLLETHVHADHITAAPYIKAQLGGQIGIGDRIPDVQDTWNSIFNYKEGMRTDVDVFDHLFKDGKIFHIGGLEAKVIFTPGHTNVDVTYLIGDSAFVGDTLFMPDYGTARADFPGGNARQLYRSIQKILALPDDTRLFMCHDYLPKERKEHRWLSSVGEEKKNIHINGVGEDKFVEMREARDKNLETPTLLYPSLQMNIRGGRRPPAEDNGVSYIRIPMK